MHRETLLMTGNSFHYANPKQVCKLVMQFDKLPSNCKFSSFLTNSNFERISCSLSHDSSNKETLLYQAKENWHLQRFLFAFWWILDVSFTTSALHHPYKIKLHDPKNINKNSYYQFEGTCNTKTTDRISSSAFCKAIPIPQTIWYNW